MQQDDSLSYHQPYPSTPGYSSEASGYHHPRDESIPVSEGYHCERSQQHGEHLDSYHDCSPTPSQTSMPNFQEAYNAIEGNYLYSRGEEPTKFPFTAYSAESCSDASPVSSTIHYQGQYQSYPTLDSFDTYKPQGSFQDSSEFYQRQQASYHANHSGFQQNFPVDQKPFHTSPFGGDGFYNPEQPGYPGYQGYYDPTRLGVPDGNFGRSLYGGNLNVQVPRHPYRRRPSLTLASPLTPESR